MTQDLDPLDYRIVGSAPGESIELAWQACTGASQGRPGVKSPARALLVDPPPPGHDNGSWSRLWTTRLEFGEAVGWPTRCTEEGVQWYKFIGISTPVPDA